MQSCCCPFIFFLISLKYEFVIMLGAIALCPASHLRMHVLQHQQGLLLNELVLIIYCRPHLRRKQEQLKPIVGDVPSTVDDF